MSRDTIADWQAKHMPEFLRGTAYNDRKECLR
jgi:hypothetical protein